MVADRIVVHMGEGVVTRAPHIVLSLGLGSCVVVTLYDPKRRIGGLAHIMLPDSHGVNGHHSPYQCADTAIAALMEELRRRGAVQRDIVAKMVGGSRMFSSYEDVDMGVGEQNITSVQCMLRGERIPLLGQDIGGHHGRNVEFWLDSGRVSVQAIGKHDREI